MKQSLCKTLLLASGFVLSLGSAWADQLVLVDRNELTVGPLGAETTIQWESSFEDLNYTNGELIALAVNWEVITGVAEFQGFMEKPKGFTPKGVEGRFMDTTVTDPPPETSAQGVLQFTALKPTKKAQKGTAHLHLILKVDSTGDGQADLDVALGVNVHVCDHREPGACPSE